MQKTEIIAAGYYVARVLETPAALAHELLPERVLTLSPCLTEFFPDAWAIEWVTNSDAERLAAASALGIPSHLVPAVVRHMTDALSALQLGWPGVWLSLTAGRAAANDFLPDSSDFALLGLGVPGDLVESLSSAVEPKPGEGPSGLYQTLSRRAPLEPTGDPAGWELLGVELGACHSWLCNSVHVLAQSRLGITPNALGLIPTEEQARQVTTLISQDPSIAEPASWFPGLLVRYPL